MDLLRSALNLEANMNFLDIDKVRQPNATKQFSLGLDYCGLWLLLLPPMATLRASKRPPIADHWQQPAGDKDKDS